MKDEWELNKFTMHEDVYIKKDDKQKEDILKGTVICKAKKCENYLYKNESTSLPGYCWECG